MFFFFFLDIVITLSLRMSTQKTVKKCFYRSLPKTYDYVCYFGSLCAENSNLFYIIDIQRV